MHGATITWLMALILALTLAAPSLSLGEVARQGQGAPVQVIRRVTVSKAYPLGQEASTGRTPRQALKNQAKNQTKNQSKSSAGANRSVKNPPLKPRSLAIRGTPILSTPICTTAALGTPGSTKTTRSKQIRSRPLRLKIKRV